MFSIFKKKESKKLNCCKIVIEEVKECCTEDEKTAKKEKCNDEMKA
jgi:hypothetical protein